MSLTEYLKPESYPVSVVVEVFGSLVLAGFDVLWLPRSSLYRFLYRELVSR